MERVMMKIDLHNLARAFGGLPEGQHMKARQSLQGHVPTEALDAVAFMERQKKLNEAVFGANKALEHPVNVII